jgi:NAD(P)-dependent dehydrogenase (short-subunit alcohol dehydrogenase family)
MNHLFDISDKVAVVTGGAHGLGRMIAEGFARAGAKVYITSRKSEALEEAVRAIGELSTCIGITADLTTPAAAIAVADQIKAREPALHVLVNNAGRTWGAPLETFPDSAWSSVMTVNVQSPFALVRELLPLLKQAATPEDPARIINIGSAAGIKAERQLSAYSYGASKAAIHHLSRLLAAELAQYHITVNAVAPGYFPTQMTAHLRKQHEELEHLLMRVPLQRLGEADDIAGACMFLASRAGRYMTGTELVLDGGIVGCT